MNEKGAKFSEDRKYRYALWRVWDESKPLVMFIGLNPSTANEDENDATIRSVERLSKHNGYGGFYMMNCFPFVSTNPKDLIAQRFTLEERVNNDWLLYVKQLCSDTVFAWGNFDVVKDFKKDIELSTMFPDAKALHLNKNGSPKHPLYCKTDSPLISFNPLTP